VKRSAAAYGSETRHLITGKPDGCSRALEGHQ
jgi:hypothetical protein